MNKSRTRLWQHYFEVNSQQRHFAFIQIIEGKNDGQGEQALSVMTGRGELIPEGEAW